MRGGGTPLRVLLIEDSENGVLLLLRELRRGGYEPLRERVQTPKEMEKALVGASSRGSPGGPWSPITICRASGRRPPSGY